MASSSITRADMSRTVTVDHGDGTATVTETTAGGDVTVTELTGLPPLPTVVVTNAERFAAIPALKAQAILNLSGALLVQAGTVFDATFAMDPDNPAFPALQPIADALLDAALPLLPPA